MGERYKAKYFKNQNENSVNIFHATKITREQEKLKETEKIEKRRRRHRKTRRRKQKFHFVLYTFFLHFIFIHCAGLLLLLRLRLPLLALGFLFLHTYTGLYMCNIHTYIRIYVLISHIHARTRTFFDVSSVFACSLVRSLFLLPAVLFIATRVPFSFRFSPIVFCILYSRYLRIFFFLILVYFSCVWYFSTNINTFLSLSSCLRPFASL